MNSSFLGLADVVRLMPHAGSALPQWVAALDVARSPDDLPEEPPLGVEERSEAIQPALSTVAAPLRQPLQAPQFVALRAEPWVPAADLQPLEKSNADDAGRPLTLEFSPLAPGPAPSLPIAPVTQWWPELKRQRAVRFLGADLTRWVRWLAVARWHSHPPRRHSLGPWTHLCVVLDVSYPMIPYLGDFSELLAQVRRLAVAQRLSVMRIESLNDPLRLPKDTDAVLLLSDLGAAGAEPHASARRWLSWLLPATRLRLPLWAWVPAHPSRISAELVETLYVIPWHEGSRFRRLGQQQSLTERQPPAMPDWKPLLTRLAFALDADPAMLRRLRRLCPEGAQHPEWESMLWAGMQRGVVSCETVTQFRPSVGATHRPDLQRLSDDEQWALWRTINDQRRHRPRSALMAERLLMSSHAGPALLWRVQAEIEEARNWLAAYLNDAEAEASQVPGYVNDLLYRFGSDAAMGQQHETLLARLGALAGVRPEGMSTTAWLRASQIHQGPEKPLVLPWAMTWIDPGGANVFKPWIALKQGHEDARHLGLLSATKPWLYADWASGRDSLKERAASDDWLVLADASGVNRLRIGAVQRQPWQERLGRDRFGVFSELVVKSLPLRFRYLPPGTFLMGSPEGVGHNDERPQHPVTLTEGFWMAETPCTQALWAAVMGVNPSEFKTNEDAQQRPVENVSFNDVTAFLKRLKVLLSEDVEAALPSEAEWEYACRASTQTAYWWGNEPDDSRANWGEKLKGTTPVCRYPPNPWALYDMHGNVLEWCADDRCDYKAEASENPTGSVDTEARVVRGGSWSFHSDNARSAFRFWRHDGYRSRDLGFRFLLRSSNPSPEGSV